MVIHGFETIAWSYSMTTICLIVDEVCLVIVEQDSSGGVKRYILDQVDALILKTGVRAKL